MWYFIGWSIFFIFFKLYLGFEVIGRHNVPSKGAFIFASNHTSYFDPILLGTSLYRSLNYMAREDLFENPTFGWALRKVHAFPVKRDYGHLRAIREALRILNGGKPLVVFPEGGRSLDGSLRSGRPGIGFIAAKSGVPVVPAYIEGSFQALPKGVKTLNRHPVKVYIGQPVNFDKSCFVRKDKKVYQEMSDEIMKKISQLREAYGRQTG